MESLAAMVALMLGLSILLSATALLFALLARRRRASRRAAAIWLIVAAIDVSLLVATGQWRAYILQLILLVIAFSLFVTS